MKAGMRTAVLTVLTWALFLGPSKESRAMMDMGGGWYCQTMEVMGQYQGMTCNYLGDPGGGGGYYDEGGGGGGGVDYGAFCSDHLYKKPGDCVNEIAMPSSAEYGYGAWGGVYAGGSGIPKLIAWKNSGTTVARGIAAKIDTLLQAHTQQLANGYVSRINADTALTNGLQSICLEQNRLLPYPYSVGTQNCLRALNRLVQERNDSTRLSGLKNWISVNNANFGASIVGLSFDFQTLISQIDPGNSLEKKASLIDKDRKCAQWWEAARANGCVQ